jgi:hypothetical protein
MANKKFSEFTLKTDSANVDFVVGYDGTDNVRIAPSNLSSGGASDLNGLSDVTIENTNENSYFVEIPASRSGDLGNLGLGVDALENLTGGDYNLAIGANALNTLTTSQNATAVGYNAGAEAGTNLMGDTTLIGNSAGFGRSGYRTVAVGAGAMSFGSGKTAVNRNTAIGYHALYRIDTNAVDNVAVGAEAGDHVSTGTQNVFIGEGAGDGTNAIETGSNNILIGYNSAATSSSVSNEITLGNSSITALRCAVTSITSISDQRDKTDIKNISYGLDFIDSLQPREFVWDNRAEITKEYDEEGNATEVEFYSANKGKKDFGFIAQEVQSVDDDTLRLVYDGNPDKLELSYGKLVPILVQAIKDLKAEVELLKG